MSSADARDVPRLEALPFRVPDLTSPVDVDALIALGPPAGLVKGMFFAMIQQRVREAGAGHVGRDRYVAFRGYPLEEWLRFLPEAADRAHPRLPTREGMRRFGQAAFETFETSVPGRVLFSLAGRNPMGVTRAAGRAFTAIASHGRVEVEVADEGRAVLRYLDMWDYLESWHVGVVEGAAAAIGHVPALRVRMADHCHGEIEIRWST
ncbi:MAG: DUF2378 family protein [Myxococcota bacterium]